MTIQNNDVPPQLMAIDNIYLKVNEEIGEITYGNHFCSGPAGYWIDEMDPDQDEDSPTDSLLPYQYVCNGQPSFGWTGNNCCGDDSNCGDNECGDPNDEREYFSDTRAGCWAGYLVTQDKKISDALNDPELYPDVMYHDGEFHACNETVVVNSENAGHEVIPEEGFTLSAEPICQVHGTNFCDPDGYWSNENSHDGAVLSNQRNNSKTSINLIRNGRFLPE